MPALTRDLPEGETYAASKYSSFDFENYNVEEVLSFPLTIGGCILSAIGNNYLPVILDATRNFVVCGPRSLGLETTGVGAGNLKVEVQSGARATWVSLVKISSTTEIRYAAYDKTGNEIKRSMFAFDPADPLGTYRTFPIVTINAKLTALTFFDMALLVRVNAVDY